MKPYGLLLIFGSVAAQPPQYALIDLGSAVAHGINNNGDVVGQRNNHAFLYKAAQKVSVDLGTLGGSSSNAYAVNDCQAVAGSSFVRGDQSYHAMYYRNGSRTDLGILPNQGSSSAAQGLSNTGMVVGFAFLAGNGITRATVFSRGVASNLGSQDNSQAVTINLSNDIGGDVAAGFIIEDGLWSGIGMQVRGINDYSDLVGNFQVNGASHAAVYHEGQITDIGNLASQPGWNSHANAINDAGEIVGQSDALPPGTNQGVQRAFLYRQGMMEDLSTLIAPGSQLESYVTLTEAVGINDSGWIAANGTDSRYGSRAYLLERTSPALLWTRTKGGCH